jgi:hypothetical protein
MMKRGESMDDEEKLKGNGAERRKYFRVDDILQLAIRIVREDPSRVKAKVCSGIPTGLGAPQCHEAMVDERIPPRLWDMLVDIQSKLGLILEKLCQQTEGLTRGGNRRVTLSAAGISVFTPEAFSLGQFVEVQMLLTIHAPVWVVVYGQVTRCHQVQPDENEVAIDFTDMDEDIRDMINYYTLRRQREIIRKQRGYEA